MKKYTWCFAGQIHAQGGRAKMIESLKKCNGEYHLQVNKGWQSKDSLGAQDYRGILSDSFFVPCPRGNTSIDTFRLYEALEVGSIPIVEKSDYWENLLGEHPLIETDCWDGIHKDINLLLENKQWVEEHSKKIQKWWSDYKISLKTKIKNIISDQKEDIEINKKYDICFCCDSNLIQYAINPINAIIQKNKEKNITIHFIYSGEESELTFIEQFLENKPNFTFKKYIQSELNIKFDKSWRSISHLSNATNLKLQIPEILQGIDKVIYFDIDTIPYVDLKEFDSVKTDVSGIAMRQEIKNGWRTFNGSKGTITENKNPIPFGNRIIGNSGVMVLDLVELRQNNFTEFCLNEKRKNNYNIPLTGGDQDLINIFCQCNFNILPDELNILVSDQLNNINDNTFEFKRYDCFEKNGAHYLAKKNVYKSSQGVLHFIGKDKPWNSYGLTSDFWRKFSLINENINLHERAPVEIVDYFDIDCQLTKNNLCNIVKQIQDKKFNCNMLVFGLGKDSVIYDTVNKGYTLFIETNQAWIDLNEKIKNKILYTFPTTVQDSLPINKDYLSKFDMPDFIKKTKWDIILIDAPPGDRLAAPGRALPIYWSSQIAKKYCTTVFIDDCCRDLEKEYCDEFFSEIHFNMNRDIERDEFRAYKQKQNNAPIDPHLKTKKQQFIKIKDKWEKLVNKDTFLEWAEDSNFKASFSCYNPGHKIGIVSLYTPEIESYAIYSELNIREYCEKQGYTFYVYRDSLDKSSHGNWSKAKALLNHIDDHEEIIWMDSDVVIYNPEKKFEDILSRCVPIKKVIACEDIGSNNKNLKKGSVFNSGVVIFRKHEYTKNILKRWWNFRLDHDTSDLYSEGGDQEVLIDILKKSDPFGHNHKVFPMNTFNTEPRFVDDDTFILHFMAYPRHLKDFFIKHFYFNS